MPCKTEYNKHFSTKQRKRAMARCRWSKHGKACGRKHAGGTPPSSRSRISVKEEGEHNALEEYYDLHEDECEIRATDEVIDLVQFRDETGMDPNSTREEIEHARDLAIAKEVHAQMCYGSDPCCS